MQRERLGSRLGFILLSAGCAIGIGNVWKFPYMVGGEPSSVEFCHYAGLNYVSCSPFRVPIARLAAAHAALKEK